MYLVTPTESEIGTFACALHCLMSMNKNSGDGNARPGRLEALRILVQKPSKEVLIRNLFKALKIIWVRNDILVPTLAQDYFQFYCCGPQLKRWFFMTLFFLQEFLLLLKHIWLLNFYPFMDKLNTTYNIFDFIKENSYEYTKVINKVEKYNNELIKEYNQEQDELEKEFEEESEEFE